MAPQPPLGRNRAVASVLAGELPMSMGSPHPIAMVLEQDGRFRIRELVVDPAAAQRLRDEARAGNVPFTPEAYYELGAPTGVIHVDAATREELVATMQQMPWPANW